MGARAREVRATSIDKRDNYIHIETKGCIVNIYPALINLEGRQVTTIEVLPDQTTDPYEFDIGQSITRVKEKVKLDANHTN